MQSMMVYPFEQALIREPLAVSPDTALSDVIALMSQPPNPFQAHVCEIDASNRQAQDDAQNSCVLVIQDAQLWGILTERDVVRLIAEERSLTDFTVADVMSKPVVTLQADENLDVLAVLNVMRRHRIRHLPIVNQQQVLGVLTPRRLRCLLQPADFMRFRQVREVMNTKVIHAAPTDSVLQLTQMMSRHHVSCVVLTESTSITSASTTSASLHPMGIVTERDVVEFQRLGLDLGQTQAHAVMSKPLFLVNPQDSLWAAHQTMQRHKVRRLVVANAQGHLQGIVTQRHLLPIDSLEVFEVLDFLQQEVARLEAHNQVLLRQQNQDLEQAVQARTLMLQRREQMLRSLALGVSATAGEDFLRSLVLHLTQALQIEYAYIGRLQTEHRMRTLATHGDWDIDAGFEYDLAGTPCEQVIASQTCIYPRAVQAQFPQDRLLQTYQIEGYLGTPLQDSKGQAIGILVVLSRQPINEPDFMLEVLQTFAARVSTELDRQQIASEYQRFFSHSVDMLCVAGMDGYFKQLNPSFEKVLGYSTAELLTQPFLDFIHPADQEATVKEVERLATGNITVDFENRYRCQDGSYRWFLWTATPHLEQQLIYATARDLTDRKQMEQSLTQKAKQQATVARLGQLALTTQDLDHFMAEIVKAIARTLNVEYCKILELLPDGESMLLKAGIGWQTGLVGQAVIGTVQDYQAGYTLHSDYPVIVEDLENDQRFRGLPLLRDHNVVSGMSVIIYGQHKPYGILGAYTVEHCHFNENDVAFLQAMANLLTQALERQQAEMLLQKSEARYRALVDSAPVGIFQTNAQGDCQLVNERWQTMTGLTATEAMGSGWVEALHPNDRERIWAEWDQATRLEQEFEAEYRFLKPTGEIVWVFGRAISIRDDAGTVIGYLGTVTDITEKKQLEMQFLRAQRFESIGTLASGIAHDLNNILTPIYGVAQLLPLQLPDASEQIQHQFKIIQDSAKRGTEIVQQVLSFARGVEGERNPLNIKHLISEIRNFTYKTFPKSIQISIDLPRELGSVLGDATQLYQVFMNLFVNARDAMPEGGTLTVTAHNVHLDQALAANYMEALAGAYIQVTVTDTGMGIPDEHLERIFEPFYSTKQAKGGTGLGLSTVYSIVKSHGGFINVTSKVNQGSRFEVYLPVVETAEIIESDTLDCPMGRGELILVVDDEAMIRDVAKNILERHNYRAMVAADGIDAIAQYAQHQTEIKLVLIDMEMPELDGITTIQALRRINSDLNVIIASGSPVDGQRTAPIGDSIKGLLSKPYASEVLLHKVHQALQAH